MLPGTSDSHGCTQEYFPGYRTCEFFLCATAVYTSVAALKGVHPLPTTPRPPLQHLQLPMRGLLTSLYCSKSTSYTVVISIELFCRSRCMPPVESMLALLRRMQLWRMLCSGMLYPGMLCHGECYAPECHAMENAILAWDGECYGELNWLNIYMSGRCIKAL